MATMALGTIIETVQTFDGFRLVKSEGAIHLINDEQEIVLSDLKTVHQVFEKNDHLYLSGQDEQGTWFALDVLGRNGMGSDRIRSMLPPNRGVFVKNIRLYEENPTVCAVKHEVNWSQKILHALKPLHGIWLYTVMALAMMPVFIPPATFFLACVVFMVSITLLRVHFSNQHIAQLKKSFAEAREARSGTTLFDGKLCLFEGGPDIGIEWNKVNDGYLMRVIDLASFKLLVHWKDRHVHLNNGSLTFHSSDIECHDREDGVGILRIGTHVLLMNTPSALEDLSPRLNGESISRIFYCGTKVSVLCEGKRESRLIDFKLERDLIVQVNIFDHMHPFKVVVNEHERFLAHTDFQDGTSIVIFSDAWTDHDAPVFAMLITFDCDVNIEKQKDLPVGIFPCFTGSWNEPNGGFVLAEHYPFNLAGARMPKDGDGERETMRSPHFVFSGLGNMEQCDEEPVRTYVIDQRLFYSTVVSKSVYALREFGTPTAIDLFGDIPSLHLEEDAVVATGRPIESKTIRLPLGSKPQQSQND